MTRHYAHSWSPSMEMWRAQIRYVLPNIRHRREEVSIGTGLQQPDLIYQGDCGGHKPKAIEKTHGCKPGPKKGWRRIKWVDE